MTGAASGIGRAGALAFAREGAKVLVTTGSNIDGGEETVRLIKEAGGEASFLKSTFPTKPTSRRWSRPA